MPSGFVYTGDGVTLGAEGSNAVLLKRIIKGSKTHDWGALTAPQMASTTVTVTGANIGDFACATMSVDQTGGGAQGSGLTAYVSAADTVTVINFSVTGNPNIASGTLTAFVFDVT